MLIDPFAQLASRGDDRGLSDRGAPSNVESPAIEGTRVAGARYALEGDQERVIAKLLWRAVRNACPRWMSDHVDDIVQKCILRLLEREKRRGERGSYCASYLYQVATSVVLNEVRSHRRRSQRVRLAALPGIEDASPSPAQDPETKVAGQQLSARIHECLRNLSSERRAAVALHMQGYTTTQVAQRLGWEKKRTQNLITRGRKDLRGCLAAKGAMQ